MTLQEDWDRCVKGFPSLINRKIGKRDFENKIYLLKIFKWGEELKRVPFYKADYW